jgi:hypothetical protein
VNKKELERKRISDAVDRYLKNGGKITKLTQEDISKEKVRFIGPYSSKKIYNDKKQGE